MSNKVKRLSVNLGADFFLRLKILAAQRDMTLSELVRMSLVRYAQETQKQHTMIRKQR